MPPKMTTRAPMPIDGGPQPARPSPAPVPKGEMLFRYAPSVMQVMHSYAQQTQGIPPGPEGRKQREALGAKLDVDLARAEMKDGVRFNDMSQKDIAATAEKQYDERARANAQTPEALANPQAWAAQDAAQRQMQIAQDLKLQKDIAEAMLGHQYPEDNPVNPKAAMPADRVSPVTKEVEMAGEDFTADSPVKSAVKKYMAYKQKDGTRTVGPTRKLNPGEDEIKPDVK